jgi:conjugal transfer pilus assembly protein TraW
MKSFIYFALVFLINLSSLQAQNLGNYGAVFPVIEYDIRQVIMEKLKRMRISGELKEHQEKMIQRVSQNVRRPKPLNLPTTNHPKSFTVDPSIIVNQDIRDAQGRVIAPKGTHLNPFTRISFSKTLFFFNADDSKQVSWVKNHYQEYAHVTFILTAGDVTDASELLGHVYFDLRGRLSRYFHLKHVPAIVNQKGLLWFVQEIGRL